MKQVFSRQKYLPVAFIEKTADKQTHVRKIHLYSIYQSNRVESLIRQFFCHAGSEEMKQNYNNGAARSVFIFS